MRTFIQATGFPSRNWVKVMAATVLLMGAAGFVSQARADNLQWSIGVGSPGVVIGMTNARPLPIFVQPQAYYGQAAPVYVYPGAIYMQPMPMYVQPLPIYRSGWAPEGRGYGMGQRHGGRPDHWSQGHAPSVYGHGR